MSNTYIFFKNIPDTFCQIHKAVEQYKQKLDYMIYKLINNELLR